MITLIDPAEHVRTPWKNGGGITTDIAFGGDVWRFNRNAPPHLIPSMVVDLLRGNRIELPWLSGKVVELGEKHGVPTPTYAVLYAMLKPYTMGTPA